MKVIMLNVFACLLDLSFFQVIIVARECGLALELEDVKIDQLVPEHLQVISRSSVNHLSTCVQTSFESVNGNNN